MAPPDVSITVVAYNSAACIAQAIASVRDDVRSGFAQLIVVDNASPDDSAGVAQQACPEATVLRGRENHYFAGGCNRAWPHVQGRYWLLMNPDVAAPPDGLRALVDWMDKHPEVGAASPNLVGDSGLPQAPARRFPSLSLSLLEIARLHLALGRERRAELFLGSYYPAGEHLDADWVVGAALIARRDAVEAAGLLSEEVAMYGEDSEWCWRIRRAGYRIALIGGPPWRHSFEGSTSVTWDSTERRRRTWAGIYSSSSVRRGASYTAMLWLVNVLAFTIEALHPRREPRQRAAAAALVHTHIALFRARITVRRKHRRRSFLSR